MIVGFISKQPIEDEILRFTRHMAQAMEKQAEKPADKFLFWKDDRFQKEAKRMAQAYRTVERRIVQEKKLREKMRGKLKHWRRLPRKLETVTTNIKRVKGGKMNIKKNREDIEGLIENKVRYWHTENLSTVPERDKYRVLIGFNEPILIKSLISFFNQYLDKTIEQIVESVPLEKNDIANERNRYRFNTYLNGYIDGHQACFEQIEQWKKKMLKELKEV